MTVPVRRARVRQGFRRGDRHAIGVPDCGAVGRALAAAAVGPDRRTGAARDPFGLGCRSGAAPARGGPRGEDSRRGQRPGEAGDDRRVHRLHGVLHRRRSLLDLPRAHGAGAGNHAAAGGQLGGDRRGGRHTRRGSRVAAGRSVREFPSARARLRSHPHRGRAVAELARCDGIWCGGRDLLLRVVLRCCLPVRPRQRRRPDRSRHRDHRRMRVLRLSRWRGVGGALRDSARLSAPSSG